MGLDAKSVMFVGVLLSALTVLLLAQVGRTFPAERRRHLRIWTVGLMLQPVAWTLLVLRGQIPDMASITLGNGLLLMGFAEMCRAVRGFRGLPERAWLWWGVVAVAMAGLLLFSGPWPHYSARVMVNAAAGVILMSGIALALAPAFHLGGFSAARLTGAFAAFGVLTATWRFAEHAISPRVVGSLMEAGPSDTVVFLYACVGVMFLSLGFVLMHTERAYDDLHRLASIDPLTGVLARGALDERGNQLVVEAGQLGRPLAALLLDLDNFKDTNDRLGHEAGDRVLRHLARHAHRVLRGGDLLCRLGGDEFVALLPNTDARGAAVVAGHLRSALADAPLFVGKETLAIPMSIGVAELRPEEEGMESLVKRADEAMYLAKRAGGDRIHVAGS
jgi:diguanylate cyclase (GGDEF)-like protein